MRVLIVDDDLESVAGIVSDLRGSVVMDAAYSGSEGAYMTQINEYDAILLDSSLPDVDSIEFCQKTRSTLVDSPIIFMIDQKRDVQYKVNSLDAGGDDYIHKPVNTSELSAKIRALIRRKNNSCNSAVINIGRLSIDTKLRTVQIEGVYVDIRRKEYDLLEYLAQNRNRVVPKEEILEHVWDTGIYIPSNTLEVHVNSIRKKFIGIGKEYTDIILTIRGFGYKLSA